MKIIQSFDTSLDLSDVSKIYRPLESSLLEEIKSRYEKKCYKSCYIIEVKEIIHRSSCEISTDHQQCIGKLNVIFTALVEVYTPGNIIPVCELQLKRNNGEFIAESADAKIHLVPLQNDKILPAFKAGDKFPIQVKSITYGCFQEKATVIGSLPDIRPEPLVIYKINPALYKRILEDDQLDVIKKFNTTLEDINKWINSLSPAEKNKLDEYISATYPYKENKNPTIQKISQFNFTDIEDLKKLNDMKQPFYVCYPPEISRSKPIAYIVNANNNSYKNHIFDERPMVVISNWITVHYNYMEFVKQLTENYPSPTADRYKLIWALIHLRKENI
jgi:hypothetical protein